MLNPTVSLLWQGTLETLYMTFASGSIAVLLGLPLGLLLATTRPEGVLSNRFYQQSASSVTNIIRSIPFIILLIAILPLTRLIVGTSIGTTAAIVPLSVAAIPFLARMTESAILELHPGLIEAGHAMGATPYQIITRFLLPEALPSLVNAVTITLITLIGYSAMAGTVGGGGLGSVAINYGYQRFHSDIMLFTVVILIAIVYIIQITGDLLSQTLNHQHTRKRS